MAEETNQATINYTYPDSSTVRTQTSNEVTTTVRAENAITLTKSSQETSFSPNETITYQINITNSGSLYFTGVRIIDNLTGTGYMTYVPGTAKLYINGQWQNAQVVSTNPLTLTLSPLSPGASYLLMYDAKVSSSVPTSVTSLTNTVNGIGYTYNSQVEGTTSYTLPRSSTTGVSITKSASSDTVNVGEVFSYVITMSNQGATPATLQSFTDQLPNTFVITGITMKIGTGAVTTLTSSDYTLSSGLLTIPSSTGPTITVPANGTTIFTISGYFNA